MRSFLTFLFVAGLIGATSAQAVTLPNCAYLIGDHPTTAAMLDTWVFDKTDVDSLSAWADWLREQNDPIFHAQGELIFARLTLSKMKSNSRGRGKAREAAETNQAILEKELSETAPIGVTWEWGPMGLLSKVTCKYELHDYRDPELRGYLFDFLFRWGFAAELELTVRHSVLSFEMLETDWSARALAPDFFSFALATGNATVLKLFDDMMPVQQDGLHPNAWEAIRERMPPREGFPFESKEIASLLRRFRKKSIRPLIPLFAMTEGAGQVSEQSDVETGMGLILSEPLLFSRMLRARRLAHFRNLLKFQLRKKKTDDFERVVKPDNLRTPTLFTPDRLSELLTRPVDNNLTDLLRFWANELEAMAKKDRRLAFSSVLLLARIEQALQIPPGTYTQRIVDYVPRKKALDVDKAHDFAKLVPSIPDALPYYVPLLGKVSDDLRDFGSNVTYLRLMNAMQIPQPSWAILVLLSSHAISGTNDPAISEPIAEQLAVTLRQTNVELGFTQLAGVLPRYVPSQMASAIIYGAFESTARTNGVPGQKLAIKMLISENARKSPPAREILTRLKNDPSLGLDSDVVKQIVAALK